MSGFSVSGSEDQPTRRVPVVTPPPVAFEGAGLGVFSPAPVHAARIAGDQLARPRARVHDVEAAQDEERLRSPCERTSGVEAFLGRVDVAFWHNVNIDRNQRGHEW